MRYSFINRVDALSICAILFVCMVLFFMFGRLISRFFLKEENESRVGSLTSALFGLFGFILAFSFSFSGARYDNVRNTFVEESGQISTAILRADFYPDSVRDEFRKDFREYVEARIKLYSDVHDSALMDRSKSEQEHFARRLWQRTVTLSKQSNMVLASNAMTLALNGMFNVSSKREVVMKMVTPDPIIYMLIILAITSSFIAGINSPIVRRRDWIVIICFALFATVIIYITLDLGRPHRGLIKTNAAEQSIVELRNAFR